jgi:hypothetical protein
MVGMLQGEGAKCKKFVVFWRLLYVLQLVEEEQPSFTHLKKMHGPKCKVKLSLQAMLI